MQINSKEIIKKLSVTAPVVSLSNPWLCGKRIGISIFLILLSVSLLAQEFPEEGDTKPLLRVFPIFRPEECEWSIRFDICLRCMKKRERYAQRILFMKDGGPYREHGCYTDAKGFYVLK